MTRPSLLSVATILAIALSMPSVSNAQVTDTELFRVIVAPKLAITSPAASTWINHDESDNNQPFAAQPWFVRANGPIGATATFTCNQPFTHTVDNSYKRDASLALSKASGSPSWSVLVAADATDYGAAKNTATVSADSSSAGAATFNLNVSLVETGFAELAAGNYEMTVTGTLTSK